MRIVDLHSHLGGYEWLVIHEPALWEEVKWIVARVDAKLSRRAGWWGRGHDSARTLRRAFAAQFQRRKWTDADSPGFVKRSAAIEAHFAHPGSSVLEMVAKHLAFYVGNVINVGIEILPMKSMQEHMSSGPGYYEGALYDMARQGRGVPAVPLVLVGVEP